MKFLPLLVIAVYIHFINACGGGGGGPAPPPPSQENCGYTPIPQSRIISGYDAKPGAWPWMASLWVNKNSHICGGSLLTPEWVLTASHCVVGTGVTTSSLEIKLGEHDHRVSDGAEQVRKIERIVVHPKYSNTQLTNDIALIKLKDPAKLSTRVQTICLPPRGTSPSIGSRCYLSGWGSIQHPGPSHHTLQQAMLPVVKEKNCFNRKDMVCTGFGRSSKTNACRGDSGGPYVCRRTDGRWEQHGVASFVVEYCKYYTAFTKVGDYYDWIYETMANS